MPNTLPPYPLSLIGLPFHCGVKGGVPGNKMANAPLLLLAGDRLPAALKDHREGVALTMLDKADEVTADENGGDLRTIPAGDQMGRILVQNIHLARAVAGARAAGRLPVVVAGTCSASFGVVGGLGAEEEPIGIIWFDAHGDFNTPDTTPSGNIHGMPVAVLTGHGHPDLVNLGHAGAKLRPQDIVMIGIRDLDGEERRLLVDSGITVYTMRDVDELGMATVVRRALTRLNHLERIHVSFDMDAMEPVEAPGVGTPVTGGLTIREAHLLMEILAESAKVSSLDVVEINPILDEGNRTAELAVDLIASLLGQRIL